jgi:hypothetical protein
MWHDSSDEISAFQFDSIIHYYSHSCNRLYIYIYIFFFHFITMIMSGKKVFRGRGKAVPAWRVVQPKNVENPVFASDSNTTNVEKPEKSNEDQVPGIPGPVMGQEQADQSGVKPEDRIMRETYQSLKNLEKKADEDAQNMDPEEGGPMKMEGEQIEVVEAREKEEETCEKDAPSGPQESPQEIENVQEDFSLPRMATCGTNTDLTFGDLEQKRKEMAQKKKT